jgi:hypothetical protein
MSNQILSNQMDAAQQSPGKVIKRVLTSTGVTAEIHSASSSASKLGINDSHNTKNSLL